MENLFFAFQTTLKPKMQTTKFRNVYVDIFQAAEHGDIDALKHYIETEKVNVNSILQSSRETPLFKCIQGGHLTAAKYLIQKGANVNAVDKYGYNALLWALDTDKPNLELIKYLIEKGVDINVRDRKGYAPVHWAAANDKLEILQYLVDKGADYELNVNSGETPLHWAAINGHLDIVTYLLENKKVEYNGDIFSAAFNGYVGLLKYYTDKMKISVDSVDAEGNTPIHRAAARGQISVIKYLVEEKHAKIDAKNLEEYTPLAAAAANGKLETVKYLTEKGAFISEDYNSGNTALNKSAQGGYVRILEYLLDERKSSHPITPSSLIRPLKDAITNGKIEVVKYLMGQKNVGIEISGDDKNNHHKTVSADINICELFQGGGGRRVDYVGVLKYLLQRGADINTKCHEHNYCEDVWSCAAYYGHLNTIKYLLENDIVNINRENSEGRTALHCAGVYGHLPIIKYLVENGANINIKSNNGHLPLWEAMIEEHDDVTRYLITKHQVGGTLNLCLEDVIYTGYMDTIKYIVQKGADINKKSSSGYTPVMIAAKFQQLEVLKYFINEKNADLSITNNDGENILHIAVESNSLEIVKYVAERVNNINEPNIDGLTPLHLAAAEGFLDIVTYLANEKQADINALDAELHTPLHRAAEKGKLDVVRYLIEKGAEFLEKIEKYSDKNYFASLFVAAQLGYVDEVKYLIEKKNPDLNAFGKSDSYNQRQEGTLLHEAVNNGHMNVVKYLVEAGADLNKENVDGDTPLSLAIKKGQTLIAKYLEITRSQRKPTRIRRTIYSSISENDKFRDTIAPVTNTAVMSKSSINEMIQWIGKSTAQCTWLSIGHTNELTNKFDKESNLMQSIFMILNFGLRKFLSNNYLAPKHEALLSPQEILHRKMDTVAINVTRMSTFYGIFEDKCALN